MKRIYIFVLLVFSLNFCSCKNYKIERKSIDKTMLISVVGIDISPENKVIVTICPKVVTPSNDSSNIENKSYIINSEGDTIFEAIRNIFTSSDAKPFLGNVEHIIIGEEVAKKDIIKYLDYFSRDHEFRLNMKVFVSRGCSAREILEQASNSNIILSDYLKSLLSNIDSNSISSEVELATLIHKFDNKFLCPYIPCISLGSKNGVNINQFSIYLDGYAIFKNSKLIGYLIGNEARGLNWIIEKIKSGVIIVKDLNEENISLEISEASSKIIPQFSKEKLSVLIKIRTSSNVGEITGKEDIFTKDYFSYLEKQQSNIIKSEVEKALAFSRKNNADIFDINGFIFRKHPIKWKKLQNNWDEIFPEVDIQIQVTSLINRSYEIKRPTNDNRKKEL
ncbi:Ger(x)C family spore germination protein [Clostridium cochlearium]|uniref:Ger(x)C family spore germination protein n=1 Tax=Clostridium cochlearium TaxID=1494 RepID=UPI000B9475BF|nr:Ger(x)C family spore germination protein [Clostridium cochlearium]SNV82373.1 spore germination protein KC [Clostridium cochlearium]STA93010.1 spore germination protein KC [Clostridium cochlearium]